MIFLAYIARKLVKAFGIVLWPYSIFLVIVDCCKGLSLRPWRVYWYELSRGWDIIANKAYAPAFNKHLGPSFGGDETISQRMAWNKLFGHNTDTADLVERGINIFDKDHLNKSLQKHQLN